MPFTFTIGTGMCFPLRVIFLCALVRKMRRVTTPSASNRWTFLFLGLLFWLPTVTFVAVIIPIASLFSLVISIIGLRFRGVRPRIFLLRLGCPFVRLVILFWASALFW